MFLLLIYSLFCICTERRLKQESSDNYLTALFNAGNLTQLTSTLDVLISWKPFRKWVMRVWISQDLLERTKVKHQRRSSGNYYLLDCFDFSNYWITSQYISTIYMFHIQHKKYRNSVTELWIPINYKWDMGYIVQVADRWMLLSICLVKGKEYLVNTITVSTTWFQSSILSRFHNDFGKSLSGKNYSQAPDWPMSWGLSSPPKRDQLWHTEEACCWTCRKEGRCLFLLLMLWM